MHFQTNAAVLAACLTIASALPTTSPAIEQLTARDTTCTPLANPPAGSVCGKTGTVTSKAMYGSLGNVPNPGVCLDMCKDYAQCKSWSYDSNGAVCRLYPFDLATMGYSPSTSTMTFTDKTCYSCVNDATCTDNTFTNGNFEAGVSPWTVGNMAVSPGKPKFGVKAAGKGGSGKAGWVTPAKATLNSGDIFHPTNPSDGQVIQLMTLCPGKTYDVEFDVKWTSPTKSLRYPQFQATLDGTQLFSQPHLFTQSELGKWIHYSGSVEVESSQTGINILFWNFDEKVTPTFWLDNVSITVQN